jgi:hypothetical protein
VRLVASLNLDLASLVHHDLLASHADTTAAAAAAATTPLLHAYDIGVDPDDGGHVMIATDDGLIIHAATQPDHRPSPRLYRPEIETMSACRSVAFCPFEEAFLLVGSADGSIRLHSAANERPLITWAGTVDNEPIVRVIWSPSRPCVFFILDTANRCAQIYQIKQ